MMEIERQSPSAAHWPPRQYEDLFAAGGHPSARCAWVIEDVAKTSAILAFLIAHRIDAEWELENIVVARTARGKGLGTRLLGELVEHAKSNESSEIFLEVRESNQSARALYRKAGFEETGLRKSYYSDPPEDAILCRLRLY